MVNINKYNLWQTTNNNNSKIDFVDHNDQHSERERVDKMVFFEILEHPA